MRRGDEARGELRYSTRTKIAPGIMSNIPDFNDTELWIVRAAMTERYGKTVELQLADTSLGSSSIPSRSPAARPISTITPALANASQGLNRTDLIKKPS